MKHGLNQPLPGAVQVDVSRLFRASRQHLIRPAAERLPHGPHTDVHAKPWRSVHDDRTWDHLIPLMATGRCQHFWKIRKSARSICRCARYLAFGCPGFGINHHCGGRVGYSKLIEHFERTDVITPAKPVNCARSISITTKHTKQKLTTNGPP
jgi:hypothetical protein